ncbi:protein of unknown function [Ruminococcaceae bacterium BL-6]|nr:protein of unknown function [Ruminococcaceae bacterium BL-6]
MVYGIAVPSGIQIAAQPPASAVQGIRLRGEGTETEKGLKHSSFHKNGTGYRGYPVPSRMGGKQERALSAGKPD